MSKRKKAAVPELPPIAAPEYALTIRQPWCGLSIVGRKRVENRSWHTSYRGRLWLHSAKATDEHVEGDFPRVGGAILGYVELTECLELHRTPKHMRDEWTCGPYCWILRRPVRLITPIAAAGKLGLWKLSPDQIAAVSAALPAAAESPTWT